MEKNLRDSLTEEQKKQGRENISNQLNELTEFLNNLERVRPSSVAPSAPDSVVHRQEATSQTDFVEKINSSTTTDQVKSSIIDTRIEELVAGGFIR
jgi:hypothetical protein